MAPSDSEHVEPFGESHHTGALQPRSSRALGPFGNGSADGGGPDWLTTTSVPGSQQAGPGVGAWLRAVRRRWFLALCCGAVGASLAGVGAWYFFAPDFTATSILHISSNPPRIVFKTSDNSERTADEFDVYKRTQQALIMSRFVLWPALRDVAKVPLVEQQTDPVLWLQKNLSVSFPGQAEIMQISLSGQERDAITKIVNAVTNKYMSEVVNPERQRRNDRLVNLRNLMAKAESDLRVKQGRMANLATQLGTGDSAALTLKQQTQIQNIAAYSREVIATRFEQWRAQGELEQLKADLANNAARPIHPIEIEPYLAQDPDVQLQYNVVQQAKQTLEDNQKALSPGGGRLSGRLEQLQAEVNNAEAKLDETRQTALGRLDEQIRELRRIELESQIREQEIRVQLLAKQFENLQSELDQLQRQADRLGGSSVELEIAKVEAAQQEEMLNTLRSEIGALDVELGAPPRVRVLEEANTPQRKEMRTTIVLTVFSSLVGLVLPMVGVAWLEIRAQRVHSTSEVSRAIGMRVIGSLPSMPRGGLRRLSRKSRQAYWSGILRESVDGVRTMVLRQSEMEPVQVVLVTSAVAGEGKTSLATQLALSFARAGRRTLLIDCDLRRPAAHQPFNLSLEPGVCDVLREQIPLADAVRPTDAKGLWLLTAGRCDGAAFTALARDKLGGHLEELKKEYDFIIIDCSPVLPVVDAMLVARHADAAVLSVLSGVSQSPRLYAASERLSALGVRMLGAVVAAVSEDVYFLDYKAHVDATAQPSLAESEA